MRSFPTLLALLAAAPLAACGGNVVVDSGVTGEGGSVTGTGGGQTTSTTITTSSSTSSTTTTLPPVCVETHDTFRATLENSDGSFYGCFLGDVPGLVELTVQAMVLDASGGSLIFDTCSPAADCTAPLVGRLTIESPGFYTSILPGTYIEIRFEMEPAWMGCIHRVSVKNLPAWDGGVNPIAKDDRLWLAGSDGYQSGPTGGPFSIEALALGCNFPNADCATHEDYLWRVTTPSDPIGTEVLMGETDVWYDGVALYAVRNLRSYASGYCDDYWNWAYWISETPPPI